METTETPLNLPLGSALNWIHLLNKIVTLLPGERKLSAVNPIPKGGAKDDPKNYRPISLLSILSKLLERHMHRIILGYLQSVSPLASQQWGFHSKRSTVSALLDAVKNWQQALDNGKEVCAIFFLSKESL